jgi:SAM-dependent methyltransferase
MSRPNEPIAKAAEFLSEDTTTTPAPEIDVDFSAAAPAYAGRIPYFPKFFQAIATTTNLNKESFVLDLACGTGELAVGIARYCGEVLGIDKSVEMLSSARALPANVRFLQADLNAEAISVPRPPSLVMIGRAIPYLDRNAVMPFLDSAAGEHGAVLVCAAGICRNVAWLRPYKALCNRYRKRAVAKGFYGQEFFAQSRWKRTRQMSVIGKLRWRPEGLYYNALSHWSTAQGILADRRRFALDLKRILAPYQDAAGFVTFYATSWAIEYRYQAEQH